MADSYSFRAAKQQLENQMTDRQQRLIQILTGNCRYESPSAEKEAKELLENEIADCKNALDRLEAQSCCDYCGTQADVRETCRIRVTKYSEKLPTIKLMMEKVLVSVECADCRCNHDSQQRAERMVATKDEIDRAVELLRGSPQWQTLQKFADLRVRRLGRASCGRTGEDLFQEALVSTFTGTENTGAGKHWNKSGVDFFGHLRRAIQNISFCWRQKFKLAEARGEWEPSLESDLMTRNAEGDEISPFENIASSEPAADQWLNVEQQIERNVKMFAMDKDASAVLQGRLEGMTTAREIMQEHKLTKREYEAARERIRCQKSALVIEEYDQVLGLLVRQLKQMGFAVLTASVAGEGRRLYGECGPFDVVMISYSPKLNGVELATDILRKNPSQRMIITTTYSSEEDVVRPSELIHIPILLKPFVKSELRTVLQSSVNTVREKPANCFRPKKTKGHANKAEAVFAGRQCVKAAKVERNSLTPLRPIEIRLRQQRGRPPSGSSHDA